MSADEDDIVRRTWRSGREALRIRAWRPGDGIVCTYANKASRLVPCGPPVAVRLPREGNGLARGNRAVVCAFHVSGLIIRPGEIAAEADRVAREKVITEHWDEYQAAVTAETDRVVTEALRELPDDIQALIRTGLDRAEAETSR